MRSGHVKLLYRLYSSIIVADMFPIVSFMVHNMLSHTCVETPHGGHMGYSMRYNMINLFHWLSHRLT